MNTQAILSPANILKPAPASGNAASPSEAPETPFNQVLQREVTERHSAESAAKPEPKQTAEKASNQDGTKDSTAPAGDATAKAKDGSEPDSEAEKVSEAADASAELLALVASMVHIHTTATDAKSAASHAMTGTQAATDTALDQGLPLASGEELVTETTELATDKSRPGEGRPAADLLRTGKDFAQAVKDSVKTSGSAAQAQQLTGVQAAAVQTAAAIDSPGSEQAGLSQESGTISSFSQLAPMQQALKQVNAATQAGDKLAPPVGTPAWDQAVGQKVVWMVAGAQQSASLTLNPPDLGPMQIVLNVNNTQANATFVAAQPEVRQALEAALPRLREMLGEAGIQLGQTNINAGNPQQGQGFSHDGRPSSPHASRSGNDEQPLAPVRQAPVRQGSGMVDTFA